MRLCSRINQIRLIEIVDHYWDIEAQCFHFMILTTNSSVWMNQDELFLNPSGHFLLLIYLHYKRLNK